MKIRPYLYFFKYHHLTSYQRLSYQCPKTGRDQKDRPPPEIEAPDHPAPL